LPQDYSDEEKLEEDKKENKRRHELTAFIDFSRVCFSASHRL